ncbi:MAG: hypothetical protein ACI4OW_01465 [Alphaproteobacteria bacterium]
MEAIKITSQFGHEVMSLNFANALNSRILIIPNKDNKDDYDTEAKKIYDNMSPLYGNIEIVEFEKRKNVDAWDIVNDLKNGRITAEMWYTFAATTLELDAENLPEYNALKGKQNVLVVPQKLISDGKCGITAQQQSLPLEVFDFLKGRTENFVLGQHFHKVNDLPIVEALAKEYNMYVPGMTENTEVFGIRGVQHKLYYNMYKSLSASVGIAGTHTWIMLTMFPEIPQIILFNNKGVERWKEIEKAYQALGYKIFCIGFDENTDMKQLSKEIQEKYELLF